MNKMCDSTMAHAFEMTMYVYVGLGGLGAVVWTRDQMRNLVRRDRDAEDDQ